MICQKCKDQSHGLCEGRGCDCQHRGPMDAVIEYYYTAARALDFIASDPDIYEQFKRYVRSVTRNELEHSSDDLQQMAMKSRASAQYYWNQLMGRKKVQEVFDQNAREEWNIPS